LQVFRDGQARALNAKLQSRTNHLNIQVPEIHIEPPNTQLFDYPAFNFLFDARRPSLGISGDELTTQLASYFGVKQGKGVLVREVVVGSAAEQETSSWLWMGRAWPRLRNCARHSRATPQKKSERST
jgi:hypothetical protein